MKRFLAIARAAVVGLVVCGMTAASPARGQERAAAAGEDWKSLEVSEGMRTYRARLAEGVLDDTGKAFLAQAALPQIALPKNKPDLDRVRRKMVDRLCVVDQEGESQALVTVLQTVTDFMTNLARDGEADIVARTNAVLLVGELNEPGRKPQPWAPARAALIALVQDEALPPAVRIAAAAGLARHVEADPQARAADIGPAALEVVTAPLAGVDPVASDWLRARSLAMLARMGAAAPNGTAAAAAKMLLDATRSCDVRVRAAATLGRCLKAEGDTDVPAAVASIRAVAAGALDDTKARRERLDLAERLAGGPGGAIPPGPVDGVGDVDAGRPDGMQHAYRRDAWRLATLADALDPGDGTGGLARAAGPTAAQVTELATALRSGAKALDARPGRAALEEALQTLAGSNPAAAPPATEAPAGDGEVPFGDR